MRLDNVLSWRGPMVSRMPVVGCAVIFCVVSAVAANKGFAHTAGFGGGRLSVFPGFHNSTSMAPFHASPPQASLLGHRQFTFRASRARQFGFGLPLTTFGYDFSVIPFNYYNPQMVQDDFSA